MRSYLLGVLDRAARTALQVAAGYFVVGQAGRGVDWRTVGLAVGLAVIVSVLQSLVDVPSLPGGWIGDVTARAVRTFAAAVVGSVGAAVLLTDVQWSTVLTAAALAALSSVVTSSVATPFGPPAAVGTPALTAQPAYAGYATRSRHLVGGSSRGYTTAVVAGGAALVAFAAVTTVGVLAARVAAHPVPVAAAPAPRAASASPTAVPAPAPAVDHGPAYLAALSRDGVPTPDRSTAALEMVAEDVCAQRHRLTDVQLTDRITTAVPGKWTREQASVIVDDAVSAYC